jgi:predicted phage terminase large subunit-like protein
VEWFFGTISSRLDDFETGHKVVIQQRLHEADLSGELLRRKADYVALILPAEFEPERACVTPIWSDPRTEPGQILSPRFTREALDDLKASLGSLRYAGQYQQRPAPASGGVWQRKWFRFWQPPWQNLAPVRVRTASTGVDRKDGVIEQLPATIPERFDSILLSCDLTFGTKARTSDYAALLAAGRQGANYYILHVVREKLDYPQTVAAIRSLVDRFKPSRVLVEQSASGFAVLQSLQREIPGLIGVKPGADSKTARFSACAAVIEAGQVFLPHPSLFTWVEIVLDEFSTVPAARHDDVADALQILLNYGIQHRAGRQWDMCIPFVMQ